MALTIRIARGPLWALLDQFACSANTFLVLSVVASRGSVASFAATSLAFVPFAVGISIARAWGTTPLLMKGVESRLTRHGGATATLLASLPVAGCTVGLTAVYGTPFLIMGLFLPFLALQDYGRYAALAARRPSLAAAVDTGWFLALAIVVASTGTARPVLLAWAVTGSLSGISLLVGCRAWPSPQLGWAYLRTYRRLVGNLTAEAAMVAAEVQITSVLIALRASTLDLAASRLALLALGPLNVVAAGSSPVMLRYAARAREEATDLTKPFSVAAAVALIGALSYVFVLHLVPIAFAKGLFGNAWQEGTRYLLPYGLAVGGGFTISTFQAALRVRRTPDAMRRLRIVLFGWLVGGAAAGSVVGPLTATYAFGVTSLALGAWLGWQYLGQPSSAAAALGNESEPR